MNIIITSSSRQIFIAIPVIQSKISQNVKLDKK